MYWENYYLPETVEDVLKHLKDSNGNARIMAGGTDLMMMVRKGIVKTEGIIDIGNIKELKYIREEGKSIKIGALTTHSQLAESALLKKKAKVLALAAGSVGSPQIRNLGTIGGNIVNAHSAADTAVALTALNAQARIKGSKHEEEKPLSELYTGVGKSFVDPTKEIITEFVFETPGENEATAFMRHAKRKALALPILNLGVWLKTNSSKNIIEDVRIALGPMDYKPLRALETENILKGQPLTEKTVKTAQETIIKEIKPRDSFQGSASYKTEMAKVFLARAIAEAVSDLGGKIDG
ncbi:FAD binding domain-containing protein [Syntrophomonas curvata]